MQGTPGKKRIKGKERDRFTEAYADYYPLVYSVVYSKIGDADDTEDICHDVFAILFNKIDEVENIRKWLYGTLRNLVLKYYEKRSGKCVDINEIFEDISLTYVNGFRDTRILITEAIDRIEITDEERIILDLIATHNFTYSSVAGITGLTRRQVEYKYERTAKRIISYLNDRGIREIGDLL